MLTFCQQLLIIIARKGRVAPPKRLLTKNASFPWLPLIVVGCLASNIEILFDDCSPRPWGTIEKNILSGKLRKKTKLSPTCLPRLKDLSRILVLDLYQHKINNGEQCQYLLLSDPILQIRQAYKTTINKEHRVVNCCKSDPDCPGRHNLLWPIV